MDILPRHVICILNNDQQVIRDLCNEFYGFVYDEEYSENQPYDGMLKAFEASMDRLFPSFEDTDRQAVTSHTAVNYILSPPMEKGSEVEISSTALALVAKAFNRGALAVKGESSGIAHGKQRWLELYEQSCNEEEMLEALFRAWVRLPIADQKKYYSVGMHLIGMRDAEVEISDGAIDELEMFLLYLVVDKAESAITDGDTFRGDMDSVRYRMSHVECERYEKDDFFYNPNGVWSLVLSD